MKKISFLFETFEIAHPPMWGRGGIPPPPPAPPCPASLGSRAARADEDEVVAFAPYTDPALVRDDGGGGGGAAAADVPINVWQ